MKVGDYVRIVDATKSRGDLVVGEITKVSYVSNFINAIRVEGTEKLWSTTRFEPLPILTEAPPKGSKVVKVEKSCNGSLVSDGSLGKIFTTTGGGGHILHLCGNETGGIIRSDVTQGKWALVLLQEDNNQFVPKPEYEEGKQYRCLSWHGDFFNKGGIYEYYSKNQLVGEGGIPHFVGCSLFSNFEEVDNTEARYEKGEYLKVVKNLFGLVTGELVQYVGEAKDNCIEIRHTGVSRDVFKSVSKDCVEKLPIPNEPAPIGSKVVKIKKDGGVFDKYLGEVFEVFSGDLPHHRILMDNGMRYNFHTSDLGSWALVEAAKTETEFQAGDLVIAKEDLATVKTREFQGEYLNIDQLLAKCHALAAKKSFISKIFKKGYWV